MLAALLAALLLQDAVAWVESPARAFEQARKEDKLVLLFFRNPGDGWAKKMEKDAFSDAGIVETCAAGYVAVRIDTTKEDALVKQWSADSKLHCIAATPDQRFVSQMIGFRPTGELRDWLSMVIRTYGTLRNALDALEENPKDAALLRKIGALHMKLGHPVAAVRALEDTARVLRGGEDPQGLGEVLVRLSDAHRTLGQIKPLRGIAEELERLDPDGKLGFRDNALYLLGLLEHAAGQKENKPERSRVALLRFKEAADHYPDSDKGDEILLWLAVLYAELEKDTGAAAKTFELLLQRHPDSDLAEFAKKQLAKLRE